MRFFVPSDMTSSLYSIINEYATETETSVTNQLNDLISKGYIEIVIGTGTLTQDIDVDKVKFTRSVTFQSSGGTPPSCGSDPVSPLHLVRALVMMIPSTVFFNINTLFETKC